MAIETPGPLYSYDDYAAIDDGRRYEVVEGELVSMPSPSHRHQELVLRLTIALREHVRVRRAGTVVLAPFDVVLKSERPAVVLQPDVVFVSDEHRDRLTKANLQGAPDLAVEVLSPTNARLDRMRKLRLYARYGVRELWLVPFDVDRVEVLTLGPGGRYGKAALVEPGDVLNSPLLPGFSLNVAEIFDDLPAP